MDDQLAETQRRLRDALQAVTSELGAGKAWDVIHEWMPDVFQALQLHLHDNPAQRKLVRDLQRGALHARARCQS